VKIILRVALLFTFIAGIVSAGFVGWTKINRYEALPEAKATPTVRQNGWLVFEPEAPNGKGFIFYPGGLVDAQAYAPLAKQFAEQGIFTVIAPMPFDLAILDPNEATDILNAYPNVKKWAIGGHSLGGTVAAQYLESNPDQTQRIRGLILWGARLSKDIDVSTFDVNAISIYGTRDGISPKNTTDADRLAGLPPTARLMPIRGGNHSMFGDYGLQKGDNASSVSASVLQRQIVMATLETIDAMQ
jgi:dienelactone hydrolase